MSRSAADFFKASDTFATTLLCLLLDKYGTEVLEWDPATVEIQIKEDFGVEASSPSLNRIQAGSAILTSNLFHNSLESYCTICNTLTNGVAAPPQFIPSGFRDMAWGMTEAGLLEGTDYLPQGYSHNISRYMGVVLDGLGIYDPPTLFKTAEYPGNVQEDNLTALAGDEIAFKAYWDRQEESKKALDRFISARLFHLFSELKTLPVKGINSSFIDSVRDQLAGKIS